MIALGRESCVTMLPTSLIVPPLFARAVGQQIIVALSVIPSLPQEPIRLGDTQLLRFDASQAAQY